MKIVAALAVLALVLPAAGLAKGPAAATMEGPGLPGPVSFTGDETSGPLGALTESSGWFPAVFPREPSPMLQAPRQASWGRPTPSRTSSPGRTPTASRSSSRSTPTRRAAP
jgi:hypothetical protein